MSQDNQFPESFYCPLTHELFNDPVVDPEGNSYERSAITEWLQKNSTSPITRTPLAISDLVPNRALRDAIEEKKKEIEKAKQSGTTTTSKSKEEEEEKKETKKSEDIKIAIHANPVVSKTKDLRDVLISIKNPSGNKRSSADICCVVDVSGSMGTEATIKNSSGGVERHGLSLLDIVKHAVRTIVGILDSNDRLALVVYSNSARVVVGLTAMNDPAKARLEKELEKLSPEDCTNLWDGLVKGLDLLKSDSKNGRLSALLLLTDGLPNIAPPRGELAMLQKYKEQNSLTTTISTFGFGYDINSQLLRDLAVEGNGMYAFIPDSSFVGTAFVNSVSNLLTTFGRTAVLSLEPQNGATIVYDDPSGGVYGGHSKQNASWGTAINLCNLQFGQSKEVVVRMSVPGNLADENKPYVTATLKYEARDSTTPVEISEDGKLTKDNNTTNIEVEVHRLRLSFVTLIKKVLDLMKANDQKGAKAEVNAFLADIKNSSANTDERIVALQEDVTGQVTEAISRQDWFNKWGKHYLPSLMRAHQLQQCSNFKDPGVQLYGGDLFKKLRDEVDDLFCKLPPPKPSVKQSSYSYGSSGSSSGSSTSYVSSMATYHSSSAPCFHGDSLVLMSDGLTTKKVGNIVKGDSVFTTDGDDSRILCVVKTHSESGKMNLVHLENGLLVTPYHPVKNDKNEWKFPIDLGMVNERDCEAVYSFVLEQGNTMMINGMECITLGHNLEGDVVGHPYFGSQKVIEDLKKFKGWNSGLIEFKEGCMIKNPETGLVCGFDEKKCL